MAWHYEIHFASLNIKVITDLYFEAYILRLSTSSTFNLVLLKVVKKNFCRYFSINLCQPWLYQWAPNRIRRDLLIGVQEAWVQHRKQVLHHAATLLVKEEGDGVVEHVVHGVSDTNSDLNMKQTVTWTWYKHTVTWTWYKQCDLNMIQTHCDLNMIQAHCDPNMIQTHCDLNMKQTVTWTWYKHTVTWTWYKQCDLNMIQTHCDLNMIQTHCDLNMVQTVWPEHDTNTLWPEHDTNTLWPEHGTNTVT